MNVDLKAFTGDSYRRVCLAGLEPVQETLLYLNQETSVWVEITTLLIPRAQRLRPGDRGRAHEMGERASSRPRYVPAHWYYRCSTRTSTLHVDTAVLPRHLRRSTVPGGLRHAGQRHPLRLHRQHPRPGWPEHLLPPVRHPAYRAGLVPAGLTRYRVTDDAQVTARLFSALLPGPGFDGPPGNWRQRAGSETAMFRRLADLGPLA